MKVGTEHISQKVVACTICKTSDAKKLLNWDNSSIYKCRSCHLIFGHPLPTQEFLNDYYQGFLFNIPDPKSLRSSVDKRLKELPKWFNFLPNKNFLDFGGGTGSSYKAAKELGVEAYYFDLDKKAETFVINNHGLTKEFIINDISSTPIKFDYIFSDNVIEHLIDPISYIKEMLDVANPGCEIVIKTPHGGNTETWFNPLIWIKGYFKKALKYNSLGQTMKGTLKRFWHCDPPRHLYSFTRKSFTEAALQAGCSSDQIEILFYEIPIFQYTFSAFFFNFKEQNKPMQHLVRLILLPILPLEWIFVLFHYILLKLGILSPGGITLKIKVR